MALETRRIKVPAGGELAKLLAEAGAEPVILECDGQMYGLSPMGKGRERPTPEEVARSIEGIKKAAGSWKDMDAEAFKAYIHKRRRTKNRASVWLRAFMADTHG